MKNLIRGIAVLLTAVFLCFNIYYELAPGITVAPEQKFMFAAIFAVLLRAALFCGVPDNTRPTRRRLYMLDMVNLEPLRTVKNYLLAYGYGNISLRLVVLNLAGNLIAFAPMGVFLPALFRWQRSIFFFTASLTLSITAVEVLQVYTGTGSCDVDDLILNLAGALLVFVICRITPLWHRICSVNPRPKK